MKNENISEEIDSVKIEDESTLKNVEYLIVKDYVKEKKEDSSTIEKIFGLFKNKEKLDNEFIFVSDNEDLVIRDGIIFAKSHLILIDYKTNIEHVISLSDKNIHIEEGTLLIKVNDPITFSSKDFSLEDENNILLLKENEFLLHNGLWWVNQAKHQRKNLLEDKRFKFLCVLD